MIPHTQMISRTVGEVPDFPAEVVDHRLKHNTSWGVLRLASQTVGLARLAGYALQKWCLELTMPEPGVIAHMFYWGPDNNDITYRKYSQNEPHIWPLPKCHAIVMFEQRHKQSHMTGKADVPTNIADIQERQQHQ
jgi:hypothetical protein